jgi:Ca-activated chloride channel homolog
MDGGGAKHRLLATLAVAACFPAVLAAPAMAQSPPAGTPKILLAFDASGSMATDDGAGTPKIDAAQDVIALVGGLALGALAIVVLALGRRHT